eukprot:300180-Rhodomonas_salina.1
MRKEGRGIWMEEQKTTGNQARLRQHCQQYMRERQEGGDLMIDEHTPTAEVKEVKGTGRTIR